MIKSLRLAWLKIICSESKGTWKKYLRYLLAKFGGLFFLRCNFDMKDYTINSPFYSELLKWWSEFRENFASTKDWRNIIWNNKEMRINSSPIFYKNFFDSGIVLVSNLLFNLTNTESFNIIRNRIDKTNFFIWAGHRHAVPRELKKIIRFHVRSHYLLPSITMFFDISKKISKHYYSLLIGEKAQLPSAVTVKRIQP